MILQLLWGPLSFYTAYLIVKNHPLRYSIQAVVSLGQIYGDVLYYATSIFNQYHFDITYCRPEAYYFWFYFFFMNFIWIVIPGGRFPFSASLETHAMLYTDRSHSPACSKHLG